jgi:hypothetical protein
VCVTVIIICHTTVTNIAVLMLQAQQLGMTNGDFIFVSFSIRSPSQGGASYTVGLSPTDLASYYQAATVLKVVGADLMLAFGSPFAYKYLELRHSVVLTYQFQ